MDYKSLMEYKYVISAILVIIVIMYITSTMPKNKEHLENTTTPMIRIHTGPTRVFKKKESNEITISP